MENVLAHTSFTPAPVCIAPVISMGGRAELLLDDGQEHDLNADPWVFSISVTGPGTAGTRTDKRFVVAGLQRRHARAAFPVPRRGEEVAGVDTVMVHVDISGCVDVWLWNQGVLSLEHQRSLPGLLADVGVLEAA